MLSECHEIALIRMVAEADACQHGELGALLRRERLYASQLSDWRREFVANGVDGLTKSAPSTTAGGCVVQMVQPITLAFCDGLGGHGVLL